jgi:hypothetical protein
MALISWACHAGRSRAGSTRRVGPIRCILHLLTRTGDPLFPRRAWRARPVPARSGTISIATMARASLIAEPVYQDWFRRSTQADVHLSQEPGVGDREPARQSAGGKPDGGGASEQADDHGQPCQRGTPQRQARQRQHQHHDHAQYAQFASNHPFLRDHASGSIILGPAGGHVVRAKAPSSQRRAGVSLRPVPFHVRRGGRLQFA